MYLPPGARPTACSGALVPATRCWTGAGGRPAACHALRLYPGRPAWRLPLDRTANVVGSLDSFATTISTHSLCLSSSAFSAPIERCRIAAPPRRRSPACPRRPYRRAQRLNRSAKPLIPPATSRLPRAALALAGPRAFCVPGTVLLYSSSLLASTICRSSSLRYSAIEPPRRPLQPLFCARLDGF